VDSKALDILVVDDEQSICLLLHDVLSRLGHRVSTCQDGASALKLASEHSFDLVFLDIRMPGMGGVEALKQLHERHPNTTYVMITGYAHNDIVDESLRSGASACLCKPFSLSQVMKLLQEITSGQPVTV
jgi:DNA-binding NtrC family response regulator